MHKHKGRCLFRKGRKSSIFRGGNHPSFLILLCSAEVETDPYSPGFQASLCKVPICTSSTKRIAGVTVPLKTDLSPTPKTTSTANFQLLKFKRSETNRDFCWAHRSLRSTNLHKQMQLNRENLASTSLGRTTFGHVWDSFKCYIGLYLLHVELIYIYTYC